MSEEPKKPRHAWECLDGDFLLEWVFAATKAEAIELAREKFPDAESLRVRFYSEDSELRAERKRAEFDERASKLRSDSDKPAIGDSPEGKSKAL